MNISEFTIQARGGSLICALATPDEKDLASEPALLVDVGSTRMRIDKEPSATARNFVEAGHRVVSFDMPNHGDLVDRYGQSIDGMCAAGDDLKNSAYYTGKNYGDVASETVSQGLQALHDHAVLFAAADPDFAKFILGILDGYWMPAK